MSARCAVLRSKLISRAVLIARAAASGASASAKLHPGTSDDSNSATATGKVRRSIASDPVPPPIPAASSARRTASSHDPRESVRAKLSNVSNGTTASTAATLRAAPSFALGTIRCADSSRTETSTSGMPYAISANAPSGTGTSHPLAYVTFAIDESNAASHPAAFRAEIARFNSCRGRPGSCGSASTHFLPAFRPPAPLASERLCF